MTAAAEVKSVNGNNGDFVWTNEGSDPDAPRTNTEAEAPNGMSNF